MLREKLPKCDCSFRELISLFNSPVDGCCFLEMHQIVPTPTELLISSDSKGVVNKRLVLRNLLSTDVALKMVLSKEDAKIVSLEHDKVRIAARSIVHIEMRINCDRIGLFNRSGHVLLGYVRPVHASTAQNMSVWLNTPGAETVRQQAFSISIRFSREYSAFETIIDLPGKANVLEPLAAGVAGLDDRDVQDAVPIDADTLTAKNCDSIAEYMTELRARQEKQKTGEAGESCWAKEVASRLANSFMEHLEEPKKLEGKGKQPKERQMADNMHHPRREVSQTSLSNNSNIKKSEKEQNWFESLVNQLVPSAEKKTSTKKTSSIKERRSNSSKGTSQYINQEMNATPCGGSEE